MESDFKPLAEIARLIPGRSGEGQRLHTSTLTRWHKRGILRDGQRVKLKAKRVGGRLMVRPADLDEFLNALNADGSTPVPEAPAVRKRRAKTAGERLEAIGA